MSTKPFALSIVTPERTIYDGQVTSVTLPGADGYLGIWAHHAPMVAALRAGVLQFNDVADAQRWLVYAVDQGFCEVSNNKVIVLVDAAESAGEINADEVQAALEKKKAELREHLKDPEYDTQAAQREIEHQEAMLKVAFTRGK
jgi:F-type H+-transporting ATPase subunit epsilon